MKCWKNQTTKTQRSYGGTQYISKDGTQISISKWDFEKAPRNYQFNAHSKEEARKGYPSQKLGITKNQAISLMKKYMKEHDC
jgi:hypothetical protein